MKRLRNLAAAALLTAVVSLNILAFMQARTMTRFAGSDDRTARPEELGVLEKAAVLLSGVRLVRHRNNRTPADLRLSFSTHHYPNRDGLTLEAWHVAGRDDRPLVVLFHGYAANKSTLLTTARVFHDLGYETLLVDFYGSGGSSGNGTTIGVKEAEDIVATADFIKRNWPKRKFVLYGISMGGAAVLRAIAAHGVKPDAIIVEATFGSLLDTARKRFQSMGLPGSPLAELLLFWGSVQQGFNFFSHNPVDYANSVHFPALVLHGEKDNRATPAQARALASSMGKHGKVIVYPDVPHVPIVEARPLEWQRDVERFLIRLR
ncbi:MAG TPA: alpha/beta fold hydrolase [Candidatus Binatia bacterium]|nr:alpha/beta fold hydrolase [Candidatus Binatia bacterium]